MQTFKELIILSLFWHNIVTLTSIIKLLACILYVYNRKFVIITKRHEVSGIKGFDIFLVFSKPLRTCVVQVYR